MPVLAVAFIVILGVAGMAIPPVGTGLAVRFARHAPTLAASLAARSTPAAG